MIEIQGLAKRFGRLQVLRNLDLAIPRGQVTAILGPNGAGRGKGRGGRGARGGLRDGGGARQVAVPFGLAVRAFRKKGF